jgi:parallel beta-helix repeat protein
MNTIEDNILTHNSIVAIDLDGSDNDNNTISDNLLQGNNYGIDVDSSNRNIFQDNILTDNGMGFSFDTCWENTIIGNIIQNGSYGISLDYSSDNTLTDNTIRNTSVFGLYLRSSSRNVLDSNAMINCSLMMYGNEDTEYLNDIDASNTVNGKPVYCIFGRRWITVPEDAGEVILIESSYCTIKGLNLNKGTIGIILAYSSHNIIKGNIITNQSMIAIDLGSADNNDNIIQGNTIRENSYGIDLENSKGNTIRQNRIFLNGYGIFLSNTLTPIIRRNMISRNYYGISATKVNGSKIYLNNIYQNYIYGLSAKACAVSARWNWWGAVTGPNINGNGDHLSVTKDGQIIYKPWRFLPVLFTGQLRSLMTTCDRQNFVDSMRKSQRTTSFETQQITSDYMALCGMRNLRIESEYALPPKVVVERNLPMNNGLVSFS